MHSTEQRTQDAEGVDVGRLADAVGGERFGRRVRHGAHLAVGRDTGLLRRQRLAQPCAQASSQTVSRRTLPPPVTGDS